MKENEETKYKDRESFAILLADAETDLIVIVQNISLRKHIKYNRVKLKDDTYYSYLLYTEPQDKQYVFDMARNKKLNLIWKDDTDFYIIDFRTNTKGTITNYLSDEDLGEETLEGDVITPNLKSQFQNMKKVQSVSSKQLDEENPQKYEHFVFYIKK